MEHHALDGSATAASQLPGKIMNMLVDHELQKTRSWRPDGKSTTKGKAPIPGNLMRYMKEIARALGETQPEVELDKRFSKKLRTAACKKGQDDYESNDVIDYNDVANEDFAGDKDLAAAHSEGDLFEKATNIDSGDEVRSNSNYV